MYTTFKKIDKEVLDSIYEYEEQHLKQFKSEFEISCSDISKLYGWNYVINIHRWTDTHLKFADIQLDGYTATLQVEFTDNKGEIIELDESGCSFFETITFISFNFLKRTYRVFQNETLNNIRTEVKKFISNFKNSSL